MQRKFTLIELLVVISIIGILSSMLLPSLKNAREAGLRAVCISNERQIGIATESYSSSYNDYWPYGLIEKVEVVPDTNPNNQGKAPHEVILPFLDGSKDVFICPSDPSPDDFKWWRFGNHTDKEITNASYGFNTFAIFRYAADYDSNFSMSRVEAPNEMTQMADLNWCIAADGGWNVTPVGTSRLDWWHPKVKFNMLFGDGHTESISALIKWPTRWEGY